MIKKNYDAMVIGSALGGLISGALLAKKGMDVLVVNQEQIPWSFSFNDFAIPRESLSGQGFKRYLFEIIFEELDLKPNERQYFERTRPMFQIVAPQFRLDISQDRNILFRNYRREFPRHIDSIIQFYRLLDDYWAHVKEENLQKELKSPLQLQKHAKMLSPQDSHTALSATFDKLNLPLEFRQSILAQVSFLSNMHTDQPTLAQAARVLGNSSQNDFYFRAESDDLAQIFYDRILHFGGSVRNEAKVEHLYVKENRVSGARLNTYEGLVSAKTYVGNMEIHRMFDLFDMKSVPRKTRKQLKNVRPSYAPCMFYVGIERNVLPVGMEQNVVVINDISKPLVGENLAFVRALRRGADAQRALLHVTFMLPYPKPDEDPNFRQFNDLFEKTTVQILESLRWLIPYFDQNLLMVLPHADHTDRFPPALKKYVQNLPLLRGEYTMSDHSKSLKGLFFNRTVYPNLFFTGPEIFPALGFEGEAISSLNTANLAYQNWRAFKPARHL